MSLVRYYAKEIVMVIAAIVIMLAVSAGDAQAASKGTIKSLENLESGIKITWTKDTSKSGYMIYRKAGNCRHYELVKSIRGNKKTSWVDTKAWTGAKFTYVVKAYKGKKIAKTKKKLVTYRVSKPLMKSVTSPAVGTLKIVTGNKPRITGHEIWYSTTKSFKPGTYTVVTVKGNQAIKTITGLPSGKTYYVKARAYKTAGGKKYFGPFSSIPYATIRVGEVTASEYQTAVAAEALRIFTEEKSEYSHKQIISKGVYKFDCSGFTAHVINTVMQQYVPVFCITQDVERQWKELPGQIIYNEGKDGEFAGKLAYKGRYNGTKLKPGDILFFKETGESQINHAGIYIGKDTFIHSKPGTGVTKSSLDSGHYNQSFVCAVRVVPTKVVQLEESMITVGNLRLYKSELNARKWNDKYVAVIPQGTPVTLHFTNTYPTSAKTYHVGYITYNDKQYFVYAPEAKLEPYVPEPVDPEEPEDEILDDNE